MSNQGGVSRLGDRSRPLSRPEVSIPVHDRPTRRRASGLCALAGLALAGLGAGPAAALQVAEGPAACPDGRISHIFVDNHSIFDPDELGGGRFVRGFYALANALHVRTREGFIRGELLFREGDCYDPVQLEESARILRGYVFIARADVFSVRQSDGSRHVIVDTQDEWTTRVDLGPSFDDGFHIEVLEISEENVAGRGAQAAVFFRQRREREDLGARVVLPRLLGTRTDVATSAGRTRDGSFFTERIAYPFVGELGRFALRQSFQRRDELFPYAASGEAADYGYLLLPFRDQRLELSVAGRLGSPGRLTLLGLGLSRESLEFRDFPSSLEVAEGNDFGATSPAPAGSEALVEAQVHPASTTRLNLFVGHRRLRFITERGLDALHGVQDVPLGTDVGLTLGRSLGASARPGDASADDLHARFRAFAGYALGASYLFLSGGLEGRRLLSSDGGRKGLRDVLGEADLYGYFRSPALPRHTLFTRASAAAGWSMDTPFQLTLGGRTGVRGLHEEDFPGAGRLFLSAEDRFYLPWPAPNAIDLGLTLFADAGRVWAGDAPFGEDSGWKGTVGGGIRYGFPAGTRGVVRADLAFPLGVRGGRPVFRVTIFELVGLVAGFQDPDMARSRRITVGPDSFTTDLR